MERVIHDHRPLHDVPGDNSSHPATTPAAQTRVALIHNPRSHRNKGQAAAVEGIADLTIVQPTTKAELARALSRFREDGVELLVISGGDGTVRDVLTIGHSIFGADWPVLAFLPQGKTNALRIDLGLPKDWSLSDAIAAYAKGGRAHRQALCVTGGEEPADAPMLGFVLGAGAFTLGIEAGQEAHRMGFFNSLAVAATAVMGVGQVLFSGNGNKWRRGTRMELAFQPSGEPMPHSRHGTADQRHIMLASTYRHLPGKMQLFGKDQGPIRLAILDRPRRRIFAALPAILSGWHPGWLARAGLHHVSSAAFSLDVASPIILDGEQFPAGRYEIGLGPELEFVTA